MGLDFSRNPMAARLAEGDYIVVQVPESLSTVWNWDEWAYYPHTGHILNRETRQTIPYNYIVFGVSRYEGA